MHRIWNYKSLNILSLAFIIIVLCVSFWNIHIFLVPCLFINGLWLIYDRNIHSSFKLNIAEILLLLLIIFETINYFASSYRPNSLQFLRSILVVVGVVFLFKRVLAYKIYLYFSIFIIAFVFTSLNLSVFFFKFFEASYYGFEDFSQFRFMYNPMGFLSNEWITLLLCILPLIIVCFLTMLNNNHEIKSRIYNDIVYRIIALLTFALYIFNFFVSFSRGGYLSFALFLFLLNLIFLVNRVTSIKKLLLGNTVLLASILILSFCFYPTIKSTLNQSLSHNRSTEGRFQQWASTKCIIKTHPLLGVGSKNYTLVSNTYRTKEIDAAFTGRVNNSFIQIITEKGIIGAFIYLVILMVFFYYSVKKIIYLDASYEKAIAMTILVAVVAILVRECFFSSIFYNYGILLLLFIMFVLNTEDSKNVIVFKKVTDLEIIIFFVISTAITFLLLKNESSLKSYNQYIESFDKKKFRDAKSFINNALEKNKSNSLYQAGAGLVLERMLPDSICFDSLFYKSQQTVSNNTQLSTSIGYFVTASRINPFDDLNWHNLGWLYFMAGQNDSALKCISKAIKVDPNISIYHLSKGLITERNDLDSAFSEYKKAIILSPSICDSQFFKDLRKRHPQKIEGLIQMAYNNLQTLVKQKNSPIIKARIGKLLLVKGSLDSAYLIFSEVTKALPNLNRPWYYLGLIHQGKGENKEMLDCYRKSLYLDFRDYLPEYQLAFYYGSIDDETNAKYYRKASVKHFEEKQSEHSIRNMRIYYLDTVKDDVIPKGLSKYARESCGIKINLN